MITMDFLTFCIKYQEENDGEEYYTDGEGNYFFLIIKFLNS